MSESLLLIFPNQLFLEHPGFAEKPETIVFVEDSLFFGDATYPAKFHKQKLWLHRATMKRFEETQKGLGRRTVYFEYDKSPGSLSLHLKNILANSDGRIKRILVAEPEDFILSKRLKAFCNESKLELVVLANPGFINSHKENQQYRKSKNRWFMADFYKFQRKRLNLLMEDGQPKGGQWSFDKENRKKIPKEMLGCIPEPPSFPRDQIDQEAVEYVKRRFSDHPGLIDELYYPTSHQQTLAHLKSFLENRLEKFGDYEDSIEQGENWLWHSVLTPALNIGLLTPFQIVSETLAFSRRNQVPINSLEGFLRQIVGWREFVRATYHDLGVPMRTTNHWNHSRKFPDRIRHGNTGIIPVDDTILRVRNTGYCHHIERLMVLGGFMFLCEIDPDEIYRWFMEMFVDSYDWVMVPNVYSMSQHADGGLITTKPYFCGSSYVRKMSHYKTGHWCDIWDGQYWRWVFRHQDQLSKNPRWAMMCRQASKMDSVKKQRLLNTAEQFLTDLF